MGIFQKALSGGQRIFNKASDKVGSIFSKRNIAKVTDKLESGLNKAERFGAKVVGGLERAVPKIARAGEFFAPELAPEIAKVSGAVTSGLDWARQKLDKVSRGKLASREIGNTMLGKASVLPPPPPNVPDPQTMGL